MVKRLESKSWFRSQQSSNIPLLIDEAHGAHFGEAFGVRSAFELGATAVVQSAHKTLPALTMGAWIHERFTDDERRRLTRALQAFQTSSPSYLLMASLDFARDYREQLDGFQHEVCPDQSRTPSSANQPTDRYDGIYV